MVSTRSRCTASRCRPSTALDKVARVRWIIKTNKLIVWQKMVPDNKYHLKNTINSEKRCPGKLLHDHPARAPEWKTNDHLRPQQQQVFFRFFGFYFFSFSFPPFLNQRSPPITTAAGSFFSFLISFLLDPSSIIAFSCQSLTKSVRALVEFCSNWICRICYMEFSRFWFVKIDQWISPSYYMDFGR